MSPPAGKLAPLFQQQAGSSYNASAIPGSAAGTAVLTQAQKRAAKRQRQRQARSELQQAPEPASPDEAPSKLSPAAKAAAAVERIEAQEYTATDSSGGPKDVATEVFQQKKAGGTRYQLGADFLEKIKQLPELGKLIVESLHSEFMPASLPAETPTTTEKAGQNLELSRQAKLRSQAEDALNEVLAKQGSSSLATTRTLQQAEAALATTTRTLAALQDGDPPEDDPILKSLLARAAAQKQTVERLKRGAPSLAAQRDALAVGKQRLMEQITLLADRVSTGRAAAQGRASVRDKLLIQMTAIIDSLGAAADEAHASLQEAHLDKNARRKLVLQKALELAEDKAVALDDVEFCDADDSLEAEQERDAAINNAAEQQAINTRLQQQLLQLQKAATEAQQQPQQQQQQQPIPAEEAQAATDWAMEFPAAEEQVPKWVGTPDEQQTPLLLRLLTLWQAAKFSSLPRMTFAQLQIPPWFAHRLVGDDIWAACWQGRAADVTDAMTVPHKLLTILTHVVSTMDNELRAKATDDLRAAAAKTISEQQDAQKRREQGKAPRHSEAA